MEDDTRRRLQALARIVRQQGLQIQAQTDRPSAAHYVETGPFAPEGVADFSLSANQLYVTPVFPPEGMIMRSIRLLARSGASVEFVKVGLYRIINADNPAASVGGTYEASLVSECDVLYDRGNGGVAVGAAWTTIDAEIRPARTVTAGPQWAIGFTPSGTITMPRVQDRRGYPSGFTLLSQFVLPQTVQLQDIADTMSLAVMSQRALNVLGV